MREEDYQKIKVAMGVEAPVLTETEKEDEHFINNLIGFARGELQLARKIGRRVDKHKLARYAFSHANRV